MNTQYDKRCEFIGCLEEGPIVLPVIVEKGIIEIYLCHTHASKLKADGLAQFYDGDEKIGRLATVSQSQASKFKTTPTETSNLEEMFKDE